MKRGLVIGKFMPLHQGHINLIDFASHNCDELIVLICATDKEPIDGQMRLNWVRESFTNPMIKSQLLIYDEAHLPNTSVSSMEASNLWGNFLKEKLPRIDVIFSSEIYGDYIANSLNCRHSAFDIGRKNLAISATEIRNHPFLNWDYIPPAVKPYFVKKICLYGTESTGKTTLTNRLAQYFNTVGVEEKAREVIEATRDCTEKDLIQIAELHANAILEKIKTANKLLFVDTDINITCSYSRFLFNKELKVPQWIEEANRFDLYLFLENDSPYIQDGTRLKKHERDLLNESHKKLLMEKGLSYITIDGDWETRFRKAIEATEAFIKQ
ncbi:MAG TPA: AAA family ATPase [Chitinophagales bacterium]|nr:AAA family ATPase [Chitinophagales bacterium]